MLKRALGIISIIVMIILSISASCIIGDRKMGNELLISNSKGHTWPRVGSNVQKAIDDLGSTGGTVYLPVTTDLPNKWLSNVPNINIKYNGINITGYGPEKTRLQLTGSYGLCASKSPGGSNSNWKSGLQNIKLSNFAFTGKGLILCIRKYGTLENLYGFDVNTYAIRLVCPYETDTNGDGWTDSTNARTEYVTLKNCKLERISTFGFLLNFNVLKGCKYKDITFDSCYVSKAGYGTTSTSRWSVGYDFGEAFNLKTGHENNEGTVENLKVINCQAYECWESGFHFENKIKKLNIRFEGCIANNNGQKYIQTEPDGGEAWRSPYGAGYFHSYKANPSDNGMVFVNCVANGNGAWGWRDGSANCPTFTGCSGDKYPTNPLGNGRGVIPHGLLGGLTKRCASVFK